MTTPDPVQAEPVAWLVTGGRIFDDNVFMGKGHALRRADARNDGSTVIPLYATPTRPDLAGIEGLVASAIAEAWGYDGSGPIADDEPWMIAAKAAIAAILAALKEPPTAPE